MFYQLTVRVEGEVVIDRLLRGIEERAADIRPALPAMVKEFQAIVARAFASEGGSTGAAWPQLKPRTQAERRRLGFPPAHPILQRTGKLRRALSEGEGAYVSMRPDGLRYQLGEEVGYFVYHQSLRPRTRLPRRAPVNLTADDRTALVHPVRLWLTGRDPNAPRRAPVR
jgi:hypothetical protein